MRDIIVKWSVIGIFVGLYFLVSTISIFHAVHWFGITNSLTMSWLLAIAWEVGSMASLASILVLDKTNPVLIWLLFIVLTLMQVMANMLWSATHIYDPKSLQVWYDLFWLGETVKEDPALGSRIFSFVTGGLLPLVALGFIKSLVDYIKPEPKENEEPQENKEIKTVSENKEPEMFFPENHVMEFIEQKSNKSENNTESNQSENNKESNQLENNKTTEAVEDRQIQKIREYLENKPEIKNKITKALETPTTQTEPVFNGAPSQTGLPVSFFQ